MALIFEKSGILCAFSTGERMDGSIMKKIISVRVSQTRGNNNRRPRARRVCAEGLLYFRLRSQLICSRQYHQPVSCLPCLCNMLVPSNCDVDAFQERMGKSCVTCTACCHMRPLIQRMVRARYRANLGAMARGRNCGIGREPRRAIVYLFGGY